MSEVVRRLIIKLHFQNGQSYKGLIAPIFGRKWLYYYLRETLCATWYHFCNLKKVKNNHGRVLLLVKLQAEISNFTF